MFELWTTVFAICLIIGLFLFSPWSPDVIMSAGVGVLLLGGVIKVEQAFLGFANGGLLTVAVLYIVVAGLQSGGGIAWVAKLVLGSPKTESRALARLLYPVMMLSAFMNNTPVVAMLMPVVMDWCERLKFNAARFLLPLSYATILGGMCTLIGTSTNLIVAGLVEKQGLPQLGMFDLTLVGLPCALVGVAYLVILGPRLLPQRQSQSGNNQRKYWSGLQLGNEFPWLGYFPQATPLAPYLQRDEALTAGEVFWLELDQEQLASLLEVQGITPVQGIARGPWVEVILGAECPFLAPHWSAKAFSQRYGLLPIGLTTAQTAPQKGDRLLAVELDNRAQAHQHEWVLVQRHKGQPPHPGKMAWISLGILLGMIALAASGILSMLEASLAASAGLLLTRCIRAGQAREAMDWPVLIAIGLSFALAEGITSSGLDVFLAKHLMSFGGGDPWLALAQLFLATALMTEVLTNNAAAVLMFPIGLSLAQQLGVSQTPFIFCVMIAASCAFNTPVGYQTNLMVYGPGGYKMGDYLKIGIPLSCIVGVVALTLLPILVPF